MVKKLEDRLGEFRPYLRVLAELHLNPMLKDRVDPSDIVQQTLLQAHRAAEQYRGSCDAELAGWLRKILSNELAHQFRETRRGSYAVNPAIAGGVIAAARTTAGRRRATS